MTVSSAISITVTITVTVTVIGHDTLAPLLPPPTTELARHGLLLLPHLGDFDACVFDLADPHGELYAAGLAVCALDPMVVVDELPVPWGPADVERVAGGGRSCPSGRRGIERAALCAVLRHASAHGARAVRAHWQAASKNTEVRDFCPRNGFLRIAGDGTTETYEHDPAVLPAPPSHVRRGQTSGDDGSRTPPTTSPPSSRTTWACR